MLTAVSDFEVRDPAGQLLAIHRRTETPDGKRMAWLGPDGRYGLDGRRVVDLPPFGSEFSRSWPLDSIVIITEGERTCRSLWRIGCLSALGTSTGADRAPTPSALAPVVAGRRLIVWPDHDAAGERHAALLATNLYAAGAARVGRVSYGPDDTDLPKGWDAADWVEGLGLDLDAPAGRAEARRRLVAFLTARVRSLPRPARLPRPAERPTGRPHDRPGVSDLLRDRWGAYKAAPGRTIRCPRHDDRSPSLSVAHDDGRAWCHSGGCPWSGRGVTVDDLAREAMGG